MISECFFFLKNEALPSANREQRTFCTEIKKQLISLQFYVFSFATYLPVFVIIISVPSSWNLSHKSFVSRRHSTSANSLQHGGDAVGLTTSISSWSASSSSLGVKVGVGVSPFLGLDSSSEVDVFWELSDVAVSTRRSEIKYYLPWFAFSKLTTQKGWACI